MQYAPTVVELWFRRGVLHTPNKNSKLSSLYNPSCWTCFSIRFNYNRPWNKFRV